MVNAISDHDDGKCQIMSNRVIRTLRRDIVGWFRSTPQWPAATNREWGAQGLSVEIGNEAEMGSSRRGQGLTANTSYPVFHRWLVVDWKQLRTNRSVAKGGVGVRSGWTMDHALPTVSPLSPLEFGKVSEDDPN